jgi:predicted small secreted protein
MKIVSKLKELPLLTASLCVAAVIGLSACDNRNEGAAEDAIEDAGDAVEDAADDAGDAVDDAADRNRLDDPVDRRNLDRSLDNDADNVREGARDAGRDIGRGLERAGEDIQDSAR